MNQSLSGEQISYSYSDREIIKNVNFTVSEGETMSITGKNGSGKTTLLRIIAGVLKPKSGIVKRGGDDIQEDYNGYKKNMAYLGHKNAFNEGLTVKQNLKFWASLRDRYELILPAVYYFDLFEIMDVHYCQLSAGWKKRVALARLMISDARIWLLDEPFANLDKGVEELLYGLLNTRVQQKGILIMTSHKKIDMEIHHHLDLDKA